jgi:hypothetical protein
VLDRHTEQPLSVKGTAHLQFEATKRDRVTVGDRFTVKPEFDWLGTVNALQTIGDIGPVTPKRSSLADMIGSPVAGPDLVPTFGLSRIKGT